MLYIIGTILVIWLLAAIAGVGSKTVFKNPASLTDAQLERTIQLTQRIMDNSDVGSKRWSESGDKFSAALDEQRRRRGLPPLMSGIELFRNSSENELK